MISLIVGALLLSIDSVLVSFALEACKIGRRQERRLAAAFGVCDGACSLIGLLLGVSLSGKLALLGHWGAPVLLGSYAVAMLVLARQGRAMADSGSRHGIQMLYLLPLMISLDNLAGSVALVNAGSPLECAIVIGLVSGLGSTCGFRAKKLAAKAMHRFDGAPLVRWKALCFDGLVLLAAATLLVVY